MTSTIKVNNIQNQCGANIANKCGSTITLGASGDTITLACGASQTGFGRTGTVDWDTTAKTASFTAVSGVGYFVNTTSGAITVTLPAGSPGDIVGISDYASTFQTNSVTITPNGTDKINGTNDNASLTTQGIAVSLVYVDSTRGWKSVTGSDNDTTGASFITATGGTITTCGNYKIHTFTSPGTFCVSSISACAPENTVDYVVVGGGGASGSLSGNSSGGGGAGGFRYYANTTNNPQTCAPGTPLNNYPAGTAITVTATGFPITVGGGGTAPYPLPNIPSSGLGSSSIFSTITSSGGGGGGMAGGGGANGLPGASGGGGTGGAYNKTGGTGNTPPVSPPQGNNGGASPPGTPPDGSGGGGGGAIGTGQTAPGPLGGTGGAGAGVKGFGSSGEVSSCVSYFSGGGAGGQNCGTVASGGLGGGGDGGGPGSNTSGQTGTANTGGGGGGFSGAPAASCGSNGGSGIVIIRYRFQ